MKQKLALCCALIHRPSVLFLDEPTTGVDAVSRKEFWEMLQSLRKQGITILVSTPYMDEASLCDRVALMQNGRLLSLNTPAGVIGEFNNPLLAVKAYNMLQLLNIIKQVDDVADAYPFGEFHHVVMKQGGQEENLRYHLRKTYEDLQLFPVTPNIEDCFMALIKAT